MLTGYFQSGVILLTAAAFYILDFILIRQYDRLRQAQGSGRSWDFTLMMFAAVALVAAQPVVLPGLGLHIKGIGGLVVQGFGIVCLCLSLSMNVWSRRHLQQYYAERVELQPEHRVIDTGPYAYVRHPVFTSFFGLVTGLLLVNPALSTLLLAGYTFWDFRRAARQEEDLLANSLPGYRAYMLRTPPFFPRARKLKEA